MWKNQAGTPLRVLPDLIKKGGLLKMHLHFEILHTLF